MEVRTRIAPSPTGYVHIGTIYNALFAHALAKSKGGKFILRIEDTDQKRFVEGATDELYKMLDEFKLTPDEGPVQGGPYEPYIQSERINSGIYKEAAEKLIESGNAYYCFMTEDELKKFRDENEKSKVRKVFRSIYRNTPIEESRKRIEAGEKYVIRLKVPENEEIRVNDAILGDLKWDSSEVDDQVLLKSDGFPTYHLAVVVDDHVMKISHITRGLEWVPSTPKQVLLFKYLGYELPVFAHNGLILDPSGGKLSKRKGNVSAKQFLVEGYIVEAMINFLMLIGWSADIERVHGEKEREIFSHDEFIKMYKLEDRRKTNGVFDRNKLIWFNQQYIMNKSAKDISELFFDWYEKFKNEELLKEKNVDELVKRIKEKGVEYFEKILELEKTRIKLISEVPDSVHTFYFEPVYGEHTEIKQLKKLTKEQIKDVASNFKQQIESLGSDSSTWSHDDWEKVVRSIAEKLGIKGGEAFMSLRFILTGSPFTPPLFEIMQIIGTQEVNKRIEKFLE